MEKQERQVEERKRKDDGWFVDGAKVTFEKKAPTVVWLEELWKDPKECLRARRRPHHRSLLFAMFLDCKHC